MDFFDILLAKKLKNDKDVSIVQLNVSENGTYSESGKAYSPVVVDVQPPSNSYLRTPIDSYPTTAEQLPIPKCDVEIANQKSCKVFVSNKPFVNDKVPYLFRKSAGGNNVFEKIIGGTIVTNQMIENGDFSNGLTGWTIFNEGASTISASNNEATITGITTYNDGIGIELATAPGHIYYVSASVKSTGDAAFFDSQHKIDNQILPSAEYKRYEHIISVGTLTSEFFLLSKKSINTVNIKDVMCIDITKVLGNGAQYIYSLEQTTAGAGVAWFRTLFPNDYYAYDSGSLQSVNVASKKVVGFNQIDESRIVNGSLNTATGEVQTNANRNVTGFIKINPNWNYYMNYLPTGNVSIYAFMYDKNQNYIGYNGASLKNSQFTPKDLTNSLSGGGSFENARYVRFRIDSANYSVGDACLNISNASKNGTYEPYEEHTYEFDTDVTLRGMPKLDSNNNLYYDGDVYESNGTVTRRYGIVDLGSLNWTKFLDQVGVFASTSDVDNMYVSGSSAVEVPIKCGKYVSGLSANELFDNDNLDNSIAANGVYPRFIVRDTSKNSLNPTEFAAAMVGVYVLYPLATSTTESADTYTNPQIVDADGTEEFVDYAYSQSTRDVAVPVGHDSLYYNGQLYQTDFAQDTTDTINMAELHSIVPPSGEFYITSNGTLSVDVWKK